MGSKRGLNALLCLVILVAVGLIVGLWQKGQTREAALRQTEADLTQSESAWQATAAQKEALQADQAAIENSLRDAALALQESMDKSASIRLQLATLTDLRQEKEAEAARWQEQADTLNGLLQEMTNADRALREASEAMEAGPDAKKHAALQQAIHDALLTRRAAIEGLLDVLDEDDPAAGSLSLMLVDTEARLSEMHLSGEENP